MNEYEIYVKGHFDRETGNGGGCYAVYNGNPDEAVLKSKHFAPNTRKSAHEIELICAWSALFHVDPRSRVRLSTNDNSLYHAIKHETYVEGYANDEFVKKFYEVKITRHLDVEVIFTPKRNNGIIMDNVSDIALREMEGKQ
ncbi:MAG: hypothetical protein KBT34_03140 [Prevotella sp.]|nr:hypothetical protein [Candidatus Prevotella equi]